MAKDTTKTIASRDYQNGRFGTNTVSLVRVTTGSQWLPNGYRVHNGFGDPFFFTCPIKAKAAYRETVAHFCKELVA